MKVEFISATEAPPPPDEPFTMDDDTRETILSMKPGERFDIWPGQGETLRAIKASFKRVAKKDDYLLSIDETDSGRAIRVTRLR